MTADLNNFYEQMDDAMRTSISTKRDFVEDQITFANLFDFVTYEFFDGDSDKTCEKIAEYFKELSINNLCKHKNLSAYLDYEKPR